MTNDEMPEVIWAYTTAHSNGWTEKDHDADRYQQYRRVDPDTVTMSREDFEGIMTGFSEIISKSEDETKQLSKQGIKSGHQVFYSNKIWHKATEALAIAEKYR